LTTKIARPLVDNGQNYNFALWVSVGMIDCGESRDHDVRIGVEDIKVAVVAVLGIECQPQQPFVGSGKSEIGEPVDVEELGDNGDARQ